MHLLKAQAVDDSMNELKQRVDERHTTLIGMRKLGYASTGTLLSLEAETNLFMVSQAAN